MALQLTVTACVAEFWHQTVSPVDDGISSLDDVVISWQLILACVFTCLVAVTASLLIAFIWTRRREFRRGNYVETRRMICHY